MLVFGGVGEHELTAKKLDDTESCRSSDEIENEPISSGLKFQMYCENGGCVDAGVGVIGTVPTMES